MERPEADADRLRERAVETVEKQTTLSHRSHSHYY
jgi:hypothetical protein